MTTITKLQKYIHDRWKSSIFFGIKLSIATFLLAWLLFLNPVMNAWNKTIRKPACGFGVFLVNPTVKHITLKDGIPIKSTVFYVFPLSKPSVQTELEKLIELGDPEPELLAPYVSIERGDMTLSVQVNRDVSTVGKYTIGSGCSTYFYPTSEEVKKGRENPLV